MDSKKIFVESIRHFLSPLVPLLDDNDVSEVMVNGYETVYYEKSGRLHLADGVAFSSEQALTAAAMNIAQFCDRRIGGTRHSMDARLPDGSRVHVIVPPCARNGVTITIRKFKKSTFNLDRLVEWKAMTSEVAEFLKIVVRLHKNLIISGGTGSGKTSLLNALSTAIPDHERIVVIEDSSELQLNQPHTVYLEARPPLPDGTGAVSIRDLFVDSLRMRPDRIVVGEIRRGEALDLIQSMISGHDGSMTTVHASTPRDAVVRLETLSLMSDVSIPVYVARTQVASAIHVVVQIARLPDGSRKVTEIAECWNLGKKQEYRFRTLYSFVREGADADEKIIGSLQRSGRVPSFAAAPFAAGLADWVNETSGVFIKPTQKINPE
jgi:pilus assembly protein CpaF